MAHQPQIRGEPEPKEQMLLGQVRTVFEPEWLQALTSGRVTVQFREEPDGEEELFRFMQMYGYDVESKEDGPWTRYYFK